MINKELTDYLLDNFSDLSYSSQEGKLFADKSYGFDTMFFMSRFITRFTENGIFDKAKHKDSAKDYVIDIFNLRKENAGALNYLSEAITLLCFCGALEKVPQKNQYIIKNQDLLDIYCSNMENAYIAQYMLAYCVFKNDGIWDRFKDYTFAKSLELKQKAYNNIINAIKQKAGNVDAWILFVSKFSTNILSYANKNNMVARTGKVKSNIVKRKDIAVNVSGTRSGIDSIKKNAYLDDLSDSYIFQTLSPYLLRLPEKIGKIILSDGFAADLADTKMDMLDKEKLNIRGKSHIKENKYTLTITKARTVQDEFKKNLLGATPHKCPICGFNFEKMLTASHIMPYSRCDNTEDAVNPDNGLLMCPVCDKLFESEGGLYITIDKSDGHILYVGEIKDNEWLNYVDGVKVENSYLTPNRKKYLEWHNNQFKLKHENETIYGDAYMSIVIKPLKRNDEHSVLFAADEPFKNEDQ